VKYPNARLIQFARYPKLGRVKTRLSPQLADKDILNLYRRLVAHTYNSLHGARLAPLAIWSDGEGDGDGFFAGLGVESHRSQHGRDLGERMYTAFAQELPPKGNAEMVVLVGSDCPLLSGDLVDEAFAALSEGANSVFGPAADGGYYLIGLRTPQWELFREIPWGTGEVYRLTLQRLKKLNWRNHELQTLVDIDRPCDLKILDEIPHFFEN
jgi:rSAM/selenodomain-associated transferase 1